MLETFFSILSHVHLYIWMCALLKSEKVWLLKNKKLIKFTIRYLSVSLSLTLSRNEKVEQHIRKKTHTSNEVLGWM